ncbi:MAG: CADD family putative folate metabolism protein [Bryobacteraceae bacterium]
MSYMESTAVSNIHIADIDALVASRSLLSHPFYQSWSRGELTLETLRDYAQQYFRHVDAFPRYLSAAHSGTEDSAARRHILSNLMDEEAGNPNHPELWLQFAEGVGAKREEVKAAEPWAETNNLVDTLQDICRNRTTAEALAALYAYESQIPAVAESKIRGLQTFYGIQDSKSLAYFQVHIEADREHASVERSLLESYVNDANAPVVTEAVRETLGALWEMLSGVCRRHNISCQ